jgi:hypothetical protein
VRTFPSTAWPCCCTVVGPVGQQCHPCARNRKKCHPHCTAVEGCHHRSVMLEGGQGPFLRQCGTNDLLRNHREGSICAQGACCNHRETSGCIDALCLSLAPVEASPNMHTPRERPPHACSSWAGATTHMHSWAGATTSMHPVIGANTRMLPLGRGHHMHAPWDWGKHTHAPPGQGPPHACTLGLGPQGTHPSTLARVPGC